MTEYSKQGLADAVGIDVTYVERLVALGILSGAEGRSFDDGDARRATVVASLERGGLSADAIGQAVRLGHLSFDFVDQPAYERLAALGAETFGALSVRTGVPFELLATIREAMGLARPEPEDRVRTDELEVVRLVEFWVSHEFRQAAIQQSLRAMGRSLRQVAETEADTFRSEILQPLYAAGKSAAQIAPELAALEPDHTESTDQALLAIYHGHQANSWLKNIFEGFEATLVQTGLQTRPEHPPAICFLDLTGYTRLTDERGDQAAADLASRLEQLVQDASANFGGKAVKFLGDGVMFHFREPGSAVRAALAMVDGAATDSLPPAHVGVHAGPVLFQGGDYFGRTVNIAARIADYARQGEVLVSQDVVDASGDGVVAFNEIGPVELKGMTGPIRLFVARRRDEQEGAT